MIKEQSTNRKTANVQSAVLKISHKIFSIQITQTPVINKQINKNGKMNGENSTIQYHIILSMVIQKLHQEKYETKYSFPQCSIQLKTQLSYNAQHTDYLLLPNCRYELHYLILCCDCYFTMGCIHIGTCPFTFNKDLYINIYKLNYYKIKYCKTLFPQVFIKKFDDISMLNKITMFFSKNTGNTGFLGKN